MEERKSFEQKKKELEDRIEEIKGAVKQKESAIEEQLKVISELSKPAHPDYFSLKNREIKMQKKLEKVKVELLQRQPMQELLIKRSQLEAKSKGKINYPASQPELWKDLTRWEKMPEIVQKKIDEQEDEIKLKQAKLDILNGLVDQRRKKYLKSFEKGLAVEKAKWEREWEERIEEETRAKREKFENEKRDLEFRIRMCEVSLYKDKKECK